MRCNGRPCSRGVNGRGGSVNGHHPRIPLDTLLAIFTISRLDPLSFRSGGSQRSFSRPHDHKDVRDDQSFDPVICGWPVGPCCPGRAFRLLLVQSLRLRWLSGSDVDGTDTEHCTWHFAYRCCDSRAAVPQRCGSHWPAGRHTRWCHPATVGSACSGNTDAGGNSRGRSAGSEVPGSDGFGGRSCRTGVDRGR